MKEPLPRGSRVDMQRVSTWLSTFSGYRHTVTEQRINQWLGQFSRNHRDEAARVLDCVEFVTHEHMAEAFREILRGLPGWHEDERQRDGQWRFVPFSSSAGQSGDTMLHKFRSANGLASNRYHKLFIYKSQLPHEDLGSEDTVVFVDDFAGTGHQVCEYWPEMQELVSPKPRLYLVVVAACIQAVQRISSQTGLTVVPHIRLPTADNLFSPDCTHFTEDEKAILLRYCRRADRRHPRGYGDCGLVLVLAHNCPNNSVPILHANHNKWAGLFRRHD